jgi:hypothetical protein
MVSGLDDGIEGQAVQIQMQVQEVGSKVVASTYSF